MPITKAISSAEDVTPVLGVADKKRLLREMLFARRFEERCYEAYVERKIGGFLHLYPGQEACAHGVLEAARPGHDYVITGYRDHVHAIKCGADPKAVMAELFGKETGVCKGRGGSMHIFDTKHHFMGGYALVGGPFPLAAGMAKAIKLKGGDEIAICFLGDAANNQGTFHETLNMAKVWNLPVLFVCENNLYGIGTRIERSTAVLDQYKRAAAYNIPAQQVDGQDIEVVYAAARQAVDHVRGGNGPYFLELMTYRYRGHSMSDSNAYRVKDEERAWNKRDPIILLRDRLIADKQYTDKDYQALDDEIIKHIEDDIIKFAEESPEPKKEELEKYVLAENDPWVGGKPAPKGGSKDIMYWEAIRRAHDEEMTRDPLVIAMGEDIGVVGGTYKATQGLYDKFGPERVMDTPISENGYTGLGIGASFAGVRPIIEIMSVNFAWLALDQIANSAAKVRYMSGGQLTAPVVIRSPGGTAHQLGAQHSARMEKVFMGIAGLRVVTPSSPRQAYGMIKSALRCNDPVFINEHELMYNMKGPVPDGEYFHPLEGSEVARAGRDVSLFGYNISVHWCLKAAEILSSQHGIDAEVIDLYALSPLDREGIKASVAKTHKAMIVEEAEPAVGVGAEIMAIINEECFFELDAAPVRVSAVNVPIPYNHTLEKAAIPNVQDVVNAVLKLCGKL
ncbi:MAG: pyruvate dehydrogenase (acetyl-transferring) E1 component subunit alpha [Gammaproteobacteria bacterium]|nr:pyruvate dehydrogenase (acetyl-transferring) E1 component subunit alpha [Gammaproteobacteria bacterium]